MQKKMQWETLFSTRRTGDAIDKQYTSDRIRNSFQKDYDRIIFSSAFRRLQNKTQVFPLPGPVFVHNRLTHSLEVASVGRSLGKVIGEKIAARHTRASEQFKEFYRHELATVIAAACLAHDIGNPPFGHSGEDAIRAFFREMEPDSKRILQGNMSANQFRDFEYFEGNSNAFRILTHSFNETSSAYNLTVTTLASIVKYPCSSLDGFNKKTGLVSTKKSGFFDSEIGAYERIAADLGILKAEEAGLVYVRHPFVYLTEAADDICYRIIDLEDAHRLHIVSLDTILQLFMPFFRDGSANTIYNTIAAKLAGINDPNQKVQYLRAVWIGMMVQKMADIFMEQEDALLDGTLQKSLMDLLPASYQQLINEVNSFSVRKVYNYKSVVEIEIAGFHVIGGLLKELVNAVLRPQAMKSEKLLQLISEQFPIDTVNHPLYNNIQSVVDFISGMTDLYALDLYRKITGISITGL